MKLKKFRGSSNVNVILTREMKEWKVLSAGR